MNNSDTLSQLQGDRLTLHWLHIGAEGYST